MKIVALAGEPEYDSHLTMVPVVEEMGNLLDASTDFLSPDILEDVPDFPVSRFGDLSTLRDAELLVLYTRFRVLPDDELAELAAFVARGGNILALRTANHAFHPVEGTAWYDFTSRFAQDVLGSAWTTHHGHSSTTDVATVADHVILDGIPDSFHVDSWLYQTAPPEDAIVLLHGDPVDPERPAVPSPVAWVRERGTQRIFYTSLGSQSDLADPAVRRLLANAAAWCSHRDPA